MTQVKTKIAPRNSFAGKPGSGFPTIRLWPYRMVPTAKIARRMYTVKALNSVSTRARV